MTTATRPGARSLAVALLAGAGVVAGAGGWARAGRAGEGAPRRPAGSSPGAGALGTSATTASGVSGPPSTAASAASAAAAADDDPLTVEVLTFGPGDHPFTRFGHNAIRIRDRRARTDVVYNFGTFSMASRTLVPDFLRGRLKYWLSRASMASTVAAYEHENRSIESQELDLPPAEKLTLVAHLEDNARPENREYRYDYFRDNCSTRVRDALDVVLGGRVRAVASGLSASTLRKQALRMAADDRALYLGLLIVLGPSSDRPIDEWAEDFLPQMLQRTLRTLRLGEPGGGERSVVKVERVLFAADRAPPRAEAPSWLPYFLLVGLAAGLILFGLGWLGARAPVVRALFGLVVSACGLLLGGVGCFLVGAWAFTPHVVVYRNENALLLAPFAIALVVLGGGAALGRAGATRKMFLTVAGALVLALTACLLKLFPWSRQDNGALILLLLPTWLGMFLGARALVVSVADRRAGGI